MTRFVAALAACVLLATPVSLRAQQQPPPASGDGAADAPKSIGSKRNWRRSRPRSINSASCWQRSPNLLLRRRPVPISRRHPMHSDGSSQEASADAAEACGAEVQDRDG